MRELINIIDVLPGHKTTIGALLALGAFGLQLFGVITASDFAEFMKWNAAAFGVTLAFKTIRKRG